MRLTSAERVALVRTLRTAGCVFAEDEARLLADHAGTRAELEALVAARSSGVPLEQLLGWADFGGLTVLVSPGVFVPRTRSLLLVAQAAARLPAGGLIVDLCCGTGAIGLAAASTVMGARLYATDIDPVAVECARRNLGPVGGVVVHGDLFASLPADLHFDVVVANVPYVPTAQIALMPAEAREHEQRVALDGGDDGLAVLRRLAALAPARLVPGGCLLVETSESQADEACAVMAANGLTPTTITDDELAATVVVGTARGVRATRATP